MSDKTFNHKGIRKVNEDILQDGRRLILTDECINEIHDNRIKDGTLKIAHQSDGSLQYRKMEGWSNLPYNTMKKTYDDNGGIIITIYDQDETPVYRIREGEAPMYEINFGVTTGAGQVIARMNDLNLSSGDTVPEGQRVVFEAIPEHRYHVSNWSLNDQPLNITEHIYVINNARSNTDIYVQFEEDVQYTVNFSHNNNGILRAICNNRTVNNGDSVYTGDTVIFTASPDRGYRVKRWVLDGVTMTPGADENRLRVQDIRRNTVVSVEFEEQPMLLQVPIGITGYHPDTHHLLVFQNGTYIRQDYEYTINGSNTHIVRNVSKPGEPFTRNYTQSFGSANEWPYSIRLQVDAVPDLSAGTTEITAIMYLERDTSEDELYKETPETHTIQVGSEIHTFEYMPAMPPGGALSFEMGRFTRVVDNSKDYIEIMAHAAINATFMGNSIGTVQVGTNNFNINNPAPNIGWDLDSVFKIFAVEKNHLIYDTAQRLSVSQPKDSIGFIGGNLYDPLVHTSLIFRNSILVTRQHDYTISEGKIHRVTGSDPWTTGTVIDVYLARSNDYTITAKANRTIQATNDSGVILTEYDENKDQLLVFQNGMIVTRNKDFLIHNKEIKRINYQNWNEDTEIKAFIFRPNDGVEEPLFLPSIYN